MIHNNFKDLRKEKGNQQIAFLKKEKERKLFFHRELTQMDISEGKLTKDKRLFIGKPEGIKLTEWFQEMAAVPHTEFSVSDLAKSQAGLKQINGREATASSSNQGNWLA